MEGRSVIDLAYSLVIECTRDCRCFGFYSPDLPGFAGIGCSVEDCITQARSGMAEHVQALAECGRPVPAQNPDPTIVIRNEQKP
jgi:predicted RNase H-like HicB family nuclease